MSHKPVSNTRYASLVEVENIVQRFESCKLTPAEFNHRAHLTAALWYLSRLPVPVAHKRMRASIQCFLKHHHLNLQAYNETMTLFWMKLVRHFLDTTRESCSIAEMTNELLRLYGDSRLILDFYSKELLTSKRAQTAWVEPDLKPLVW